jgi:uncharacterized protein (DUF983 family)
MASNMEHKMETKKSVGWALNGIVQNHCPRCARTPVFHHLVMMNRKCSSCGYVYERENGYFLGAMVIGYALSAFSAVPTLIAGFWVYHAELLPVTALACVQVIVLSPVIFRFARLAWIYLDFRADPSTGSPGPSSNATR